MNEKRKSEIVGAFFSNKGTKFCENCKELKDCKELKEQYENEDDIATPRKMTILREIKSRPSLIIHPLIASNFNKDEVCNPDLNVHIGFSISFPKFMEDGTTPLTSDKKYALTALKQRELDFNPEEIEEETEDE